VYRRLGLSEQARAHLQLYSENQASVPPVDDPLMEEIENLKSGPYHLVEEGKRLYVQGKINEAFAKYVEAVELNPRLVHAHVNLISIYAMKGDLQAAQKHYQAALDLSPNLVEAHYNYGLALSHEKLYRQAEAALRKSLEYNPYFADAYNNLGVVLEAQGRPDEAQENYKAAIEHDPSHREAYFSLGRFAMKQGNPQEAIAFFLRCLTPEDQKTATFMYTLAYVYAGVRNHTQARYYGEKARGLAESYADQRMVDILNRFLGELKRAETARSPEQ
jgi:tetratricopeptide (TPR) repeat protein